MNIDDKELEQYFQAQRDSMDIKVPDARRVWFVAQLRARRDAVNAAARPVTVVHVASLACAAGIAGACFGATSAWFQSALRRLGGWFATVHLPPIVTEHSVLIAVLALSLFVIPVGVWVLLFRGTSD